jgi:hypothetical protein
MLEKSAILTGLQNYFYTLPLRKLKRMCMIKTGKRNASSYCSYNDTFISYDQNCQPNGLRELLHIFEETRVPFEEQVVLEGGFGAGAYIDQTMHPMKEIYGVEGSEQGYKETKQKIGEAFIVSARTPL